MKLTSPSLGDGFNGARDHAILTDAMASPDSNVDAPFANVQCTKRTFSMLVRSGLQAPELFAFYVVRVQRAENDFWQLAPRTEQIADRCMRALVTYLMIANKKRACRQAHVSLHDFDVWLKANALSNAPEALQFISKTRTAE